MSLFVKIERFASRPRLLNLRGLQATIGEDDRGCIDTTRLKVPFFSIVSCNQIWWLITQNSSTVFNRVRLELGTTLKIRPDTAVECEDTRFTFFPTDPVSEVLAYSDLSLTELIEKKPIFERIPSLRLNLAGASRSFPLIPGIKLLVGSAPDCALFIESPSIASHHCTFINCGTQILVQALEGQFSLESDQSPERAVLDPPSRIILQPLGLPLEVIPWDDDKNL